MSPRLTPQQIDDELDACVQQADLEYDNKAAARALDICAEIQRTSRETLIKIGDRNGND